MNHDRSSPAHGLGRLLPWLFLGVCAAIFLRVSAIGWHNNLLGYSGFRQAQTAINTDYLLRDGFTLAYQTPVLGAPWALPFEFPTYQFCVALLVKLTGLPLEPAGRLVSVGFALGAFAFLFVLVRRATSSFSSAAFATGLALVTPLYLFYSRTFMIESAALCCSLALLVSVQHFLARPSFVATLWILLAGTLAALTKATTYAVVLAATAALLLVSFREAWPRLRANPRSGLLLVSAFASLAVPFALAFAWVAWTDAIKLRNELAAFTTSAALHDWNYGTWSQRLDPKAWSRLAQGIASLIAGFPWLWLGVFAVAATFLFIRRREPSSPPRRLRFALVCIAGFAAGPLAFMNLYVVHDYYFYATALFLPAFFGALLGALWDRSRLPRALAGILVLALAAASVRTYAKNCLHVQTANDTAITDLGAKIAELTPPDSVLLIEGSEWDSSLAYYSGRRALTNRTAAPITDPAFQRALQRLDRPVGAVVFRELRKDDRYFMARQMRGLRRPFERVHASSAGDVYLPVENNQPYRREAGWRAAGFTTFPLFAWSRTIELSQIAGRPGMLVHAPGVLILAREPHHTTLHVSYGLRDDAYAGHNRTDGVSFNIEFDPDDGGPMQRLLTAELNPLDHPAHRGLHTATIALPPGLRGTLTFYTETRASDAYDWSIWSGVRLE